MADLGETVLRILVWALPILVAVTLHEAAHGYVANMLGDPTAKRQGRLTLNPLAHVDPFGTVILPLVLLLMGGFIFGYAKPVPVNFGNLYNPKRDMAIVALAGPATNILIALAAAALIYPALLLPGFMQGFMVNMLNVMIFFNCLIAVFNMLPIPPLDGGRVAVGVLPQGPAMQLQRVEPYGIFIIIGMLLVLPMLGNVLEMNLNIFRPLIGAPTDFIYNAIRSLFGLI